MSAPDLAACAALVRAQADALNLSMAGFDHRRYEQYRRKRDKADDKAMAELAAAGAVVRKDWNGASIRFAGLRAASTSGLHGALRNWLKQAEKRLAADTAP